MPCSRRAASGCQRASSNSVKPHVNDRLIISQFPVQILSLRLTVRAAALLVFVALVTFACQRVPLGAQVAACHAKGGRYLLHPENEPDLEQLGFPHCIGTRDPARLKDSG